MKIAPKLNKQKNSTKPRLCVMFLYFSYDYSNQQFVFKFIEDCISSQIGFGPAKWMQIVGENENERVKEDSVRKKCIYLDLD